MMAEAPVQQRETSTEPEVGHPTQWHVVLLNDEDHTYEYVILMMQSLFGHSLQKSFLIAKAVDTAGRAICMTTHKELAELKRDQILEFGADPLSSNCAGSMSAIIEPADYGEDPDDADGDEDRPA